MADQMKPEEKVGIRRVSFHGEKTGELIFLLQLGDFLFGFDQFVVGQAQADRH